MPGFLALLIVALGAAAVTALVIAVVLLRRQGRLDARRGVAVAALTVLTGAGVTAGVAVVQPAALPEAEPVSVVTVVDEPVDVQLATLALDE